jgi:hypothetical protein
MSDSFDAAGIIEECRNEIREVRRELYGNAQLRQKGVFERLDNLEENVSSLERAKVESAYLERIENDLSSLKVDYRIAIVYLKGIAWGGGAVLVPLVGAGLLALFRYLGGV